jgi:hypothetical protein
MNLKAFRALSAGVVMAHLLPFRRHGEIVGWVTVLGVGA